MEVYLTKLMVLQLQQSILKRSEVKSNIKSHEIKFILKVILLYSYIFIS